MAEENYFGIYKLSKSTIDSLKSVEDLLINDKNPADPVWNILRPKREQREESADPVCEEIPEETIENEIIECHEEPLTQFITQSKPASITSDREDRVSEWLDLARFIHESVESGRGDLNLEHLKKLPNSDIENLINHLNKNLSIKGIYNFCYAISSMNDDQCYRYIKIICTNLLLDKIIALKEPSRLVTTLIQELMKKFPDDVKEFIFVPLLNTEIQDTSTFTAIIDNYSSSQKNDLAISFVSHVRDLKDWHIKVLPLLVTAKISNNCAVDKLLNLLLEKAPVCSQDKNFGKFVYSFTKNNAPLTDQQKEKLVKIAAFGETIYNKILENLLNKMYLYKDLWHIA